MEGSRDLSVSLFSVKLSQLSVQLFLLLFEICILQLYIQMIKVYSQMSLTTFFLSKLSYFAGLDKQMWWFLAHQRGNVVYIGLKNNNHMNFQDNGVFSYKIIYDKRIHRVIMMTKWAIYSQSFPHTMSNVQHYKRWNI